MVQKIALFNHKGGVGKTTTTFNLGWMLASKGKRVIMVDADPQCNLTIMALGEEIEDYGTRIEGVDHTYPNIKKGLAPAFESQPKAIKAVDCIPIKGQERLFLLPGHVGFAEYEATLGIAQALRGSIHSLRNLPGSMTDFLDKTAEKFEADYILIDMSRSLGAINQNILMTSDFFMVPTTADFFSVMAIDSLAKVLPKWYAWATRANSLRLLKDAIYPFPEVKLKFLGIIIQGFRILNERQTGVFETWAKKIEQDVNSKLVPLLQTHNMMLPEQEYVNQEINSNFCLTKIFNFNSLIALSQKHQVPIYELTTQQLGKIGMGLKNNQKNQEDFRHTFSDLADKIIGLTSTAYAVEISKAISPLIQINLPTVGCNGLL
ncbi:ATPase involved in chromosome partitioning [Oscillatoria acuminata PCC 6304]|uniref:ATPase involved in chromosome partitioning n=2 Tax=Oscillatoria acuminata TaxID=118323 RepID=K9TQ37_9CYAN|nr:ATPase involved in chromosome partitioning [Oscillatoria acuminata PCC 6304]